MNASGSDASRQQKPPGQQKRQRDVSLRDKLRELKQEREEELRSLKEHCDQRLKSQGAQHSIELELAEDLHKLELAQAKEVHKLELEQAQQKAQVKGWHEGALAELSRIREAGRLRPAEGAATVAGVVAAPA